MIRASSGFQSISLICIPRVPARLTGDGSPYRMRHRIHTVLARARRLAEPRMLKRKRNDSENRPACAARTLADDSGRRVKAQHSFLQKIWEYTRLKSDTQFLIVIRNLTHRPPHNE